MGTKIKTIKKDRDTLKLNTIFTYKFLEHLFSSFFSYLGSISLIKNNNGHVKYLNSIKLADINSLIVLNLLV